MVRHIPAVCLAGFLFAAGCSGSNDAELSKARADADAAREEAKKAQAEADAARTELAKLKAAKTETAAKPVAQPDPEDPHRLRVQSSEQIKVNGLEVVINGACDGTAGVVSRIMWNWGDGTPEFRGGFPGMHRYEKPGTYEVRVTSYDDSGKTSTRTTKVTVPRAP